MPSTVLLSGLISIVYQDAALLRGRSGRHPFITRSPDHSGSTPVVASCVYQNALSFLVRTWVS
jgi:hypothetical protein